MLTEYWLQSKSVHTMLTMLGTARALLLTMQSSFIPNGSVMLGMEG